MTIICALHEPGVGTWIGSDTASIRSGIRCTDRGPKWTVVGSRAMGAAGSHLIASVIEAHADELLTGDQTPFDLARRLRKLLMSDYEYSAKGDPGEAPVLQAWVIYATETGVWHFTTDGGVYVVGAGRLCADGSGERVAYGADHAMRKFCGETRICCALRAAIALDDGCSGEPWMLLLPASA